MIKYLILLTALIMSCENTITASVEPVKDTVYLQDTVIVQPIETVYDTVYEEYDYYKYDTAMIVLVQQGRLLITDYWTRDTVLDYTNTKPITASTDTIFVAMPRQVNCIYWDKDLKWDRIHFDGETKYMRDGWRYHIIGSSCYSNEI